MLRYWHVKMIQLKMMEKMMKKQKELKKKNE